MLEMNDKPRLYLDQDDLPSVKKYDVGDTYSAVIKCKMVGKHESDSGKISGDFEILSIKPISKSTSKVKALIKKRDEDGGY